MKKISIILIAIMLFITMSTSCYAEMYNNSYKTKKRYIVTCNHHYDNKYNTLAKTDTLKEAKTKIEKQPKQYKGEWYVYDSKTKKIVWPDLSTNKKKINKAISWAIGIANDPRHGYDTNGEPSSTNCDLKWKRWGKCGDYSCSTIVATAYELFGFFNARTYAWNNNLKMALTGSTKKFHGYNAYNIAQCLKGTKKFKDISSKYHKNGRSILKAGDIVVNDRQDHTALIVTNQRIVEGALNENYQEYASSIPGDQRNGSELSIRSYMGGYKFSGSIKYVFRPVS